MKEIGGAVTMWHKNTFSGDNIAICELVIVNQFPSPAVLENIIP